jgi:hypothetical protein
LIGVVGTSVASAGAPVFYPIAAPLSHHLHFAPAVPVVSAAPLTAASVCPSHVLPSIG